MWVSGQDFLANICGWDQQLVCQVALSLEGQVGKECSRHYGLCSQHLSKLEEKTSTMKCSCRLCMNSKYLLESCCQNCKALIAWWSQTWLWRSCTHLLSVCLLEEGNFLWGFLEQSTIYLEDTHFILAVIKEDSMWRERLTPIDTMVRVIKLLTSKEAWKSIIADLKYIIPNIAVTQALW